MCICTGLTVDQFLSKGFGYDFATTHVSNSVDAFIEMINISLSMVVTFVTLVELNLKGDCISKVFSHLLQHGKQK